MSDTNTRRDLATSPRHTATRGPSVLQAETGTTIVGGQPPRRQHVRVNVPVGVERALFLAAGEPEFKAALLQDRDLAARARGVRLRPSEEAMLRVAPAAQLEAAIARLDTSPPNVQRRRFMQAVAVSAAALAAGGATGCGDDTEVPLDGKVQSDSAGVRVDAGSRDSLPADVPTYYPDAGIAPDTVKQDVPTYYPDAGVPPDTVAHDAPFWEASPAGILPDTGNDG